MSGLKASRAKTLGGRGLAALTAMAALAPCARAADAPQPLYAAERQLAVGVDGLDRHYKEFFAKGSPEHDREDGWTAGVVAHASWIGDLGPARDLYGAVEYAYDRGSLDYNGTVLGTGAPVLSRSGLDNHDVRAELGRGFRIGQRLLLIPAAQIGYHVWYRSLGVEQSETYRHVLFGAALHADYALTPRLVVKTRLGVAETVAPEITIHYGGDNTTGLGDRPVYQGALGLDYAVTHRIHAFGGLDFSHYGYGRSATVRTSKGALSEPNSRTDDLHLRGGLAWAF